MQGASSELVVDVEYGPIGQSAEGGGVFTRRYILRSLYGGGNNIAREWARKKIGLAARSEDAVLALGRRFGIVVKNTSLLVLSTLDQHLKHKVRDAVIYLCLMCLHNVEVTASDG